MTHLSSHSPARQSPPTRSDVKTSETQSQLVVALGQSAMQSARDLPQLHIATSTSVLYYCVCTLHCFPMLPQERPRSMASVAESSRRFELSARTRHTPQGLCAPTHRQPHKHAPSALAPRNPSNALRNTATQRNPATAHFSIGTEATVVFGDAVVGPFCCCCCGWLAVGWLVVDSLTH